MEAQREATRARLEVNVDVVVDGRLIRIEMKVAGEGEAAQRAVVVMSEAIAQVIAASAVASPAIAQPSPAAPPIPQKPATQPPALQWVQRNRARINIGFGAVLVVLALLVPLVVPPAQRSDVLILTILFTLTGALLLFTAFLPSRSKASVNDDVAHVPSQRTTSPAVTPSTHTARREQLLKPAARRSPIKAGVGIALSFVFIIAGLLAPFLLGTANADERFLIMLGFVPITVIGFFLLAIFGRQSFSKLLPAGEHASLAKHVHPPAARRAPVSRVPQNFEYRAIVPVAIASALILMIVVVAVVIYATVASVAR